MSTFRGTPGSKVQVLTAAYIATGETSNECEVYKDSLILDYLGWFQGWGLDYQEFDMSCGTYTVAIVEKQDGTIELVPVNLIKFN